MSKKLVYKILLIVILGFSVATLAEPPLPAVPSANELFPQAKTPQSHATPEMLSTLQKKIITKSIKTPIPLTEKTAKQKIYISHIVFVGNTVLSDKKLSRIVSIHNKTVTLGELNVALYRITTYYHQKGYILAHAYLPIQTVHQGDLTVQIVEGNIETVVLENHSTVLASTIRSILNAHFKIGRPLNNNASNRAVMILQRMPGIEYASANLKPGSTPGTTIVTVSVLPGRQVTGNVSTDNYGTRFSGKYQANAAVNINNITHHGDQIGLQGSVSKDDLMDNARVFWEFPITNGGLRSGISLTKATYQVGDSLSPLEAHGESNAITWYGRYPLYLSPLTQVNFDYSFDHRWLIDKVDSIDSTVPKNIDAVVVTLSGSWFDEVLYGTTQWSIANTLGTLSIEDLDELDTDSTTAKTNGQYDKLVFLLSRDQPLLREWSLYLSGNGQWSSKNLDTSEQFTLGGPDAVRAYPSGEAGGDEGVYGTVELRNQLLYWLRMSVFYDVGKIWFNKNPYIEQSNTRVIAGPGVGADVTYKKFTFTTALALRNTGRALSDYDERPRFWFQAEYDFS